MLLNADFQPDRGGAIVTIGRCPTLLIEKAFSLNLTAMPPAHHPLPPPKDNVTKIRDIMSPVSYLDCFASSQ